MTVFNRLFGKSPPDTTSAADEPDEAPGPAEPRPDPVARAREEEASVTQALATGDMSAVGRWVLEGSSTRIRQLAAQAIADLDQLHELIRATRHGNDKSVYRILTNKRDELLAELRRIEQLQADLDAAQAAIAEHSARSYDALYTATLRQLETRWSALAPQATPEARQAVEQQLAAAREVIDQHEQALAAETERKRAAALAAEEAQRRRESEAQAAAAAAAEEAQRREVERQEARARREAEEAETRRLVGMLRQAQAALAHGGTARAARLRDTIREKLPQAPALPAWFERQLQQLEARLEELKDWKTFRVAPKRAELVARMQSLVGADLSPEALAQQIRKLREEWRTLHRGAGEDPTPEWQQFNEAADRAYEPCRAHFARQADQRHENQARREALLERLAAFAAAQDVEQPDWRAIQHALFDSRREWREYAPVDAAAVKPLQERFHALLDGLQSRLDAEYERNVEAKRALIARTEALTAVENMRAAIEEAKQLQRTWKTVGIVPRHQDNALWQEFRRHCDAIFERSSRESAARAAALGSGHAEAIALCEELERMAGLTDEALGSAAQGLDELRARFEAIELPRASVRELRQRFSRAGRAVDEALHRRQLEVARRSWTDLYSAAAQLQAFALAVAEGRAATELESLREAAASLVANLAHAPKEARQVLEQRFARVVAGEVNADLAANAAALRLLCVRAELVAGVETPAEDLELRREYQMQRLVQSMQGGERVTPAELGALALEWLAAEPVEATLHGSLLGRFRRANPGT